MAYSHDALLENSKRQERLERDKRETREIWSYGGWPIKVKQDSWRELEIARDTLWFRVEIEVPPFLSQTWPDTFEVHI